MQGFDAIGKAAILDSELAGLGRCVRGPPSVGKNSFSLGADCLPISARPDDGNHGDSNAMVCDSWHAVVIVLVAY